MKTKSFKIVRQIVLLAFLHLFIAGSWGAAQDQLPDTPAGKRMGQLFEALEGKVEDMDGLVKDVFGYEEQDELIADRRKQIEQVRDDLGAFTLQKVIKSEAHVVSARCQAERGPSVLFSVTVKEESPNTIAEIQLEIGNGEQVAEEDLGPLTEEEKTNLVNRLIDELNSMYVFPEVAQKMSDDLRKSLEAEAYKDVTERNKFAVQLTEQLRAICQDKHLRVRAGGMRPPSSSPARRPVNNHGFVKAEVLDGGIGYLKFNFFSGDPAAEKTAAAAMNFLASSEAIIFDLRENGGGSPDMIAFLSGYLFDESIHLNSFYNRPTDTTSESWSRDDVPGERFGSKKPVFVLTSDYTFSGAEEFSYNLKNLKRATLVGETTGGGAHPVRPVRLGTGFTMSMPFARAINPITKTNWEGVGVEPHVQVDSEGALEKAIELAKIQIAEAEVDNDVADVDELRNEATLLLRSNDFAKAAEVLEQVVELTPEDGDAWFHLGYCLHMQGQLDKAIVAHKKAIELDGNAITATYNLACAYSLKNDAEKAISTLQDAIERGFRERSQVDNDSDFDNVRDNEKFQELIETIE